MTCYKAPWVRSWLSAIPNLLVLLYCLGAGLVPWAGFGALQWDIFAVRFRAEHFLWIVCVVCILCLSCFRVCSLLPCGRRGLTSWLLFVMFNCVFVTFLCDILCQVWYLIVSIPDLYRLSYLSYTFSVT